ncbi:MAG: reverse transcriptase family protein [Terracidiphilus sp.]
MTGTARCADQVTQGQTRWSIPPPSSMPNLSLVSALARSILAGDATEEEIVARLSRTLGRKWRWVRPLARRYLKRIAVRPRPRRRDVIDFLLHDQGFARARGKYWRELRVAQWIAGPPQMEPAGKASAWAIPEITSVGELAHWLQLSESELEWFGDLKGIGAGRIDAKLSHYHYRVLAKKFGTVRLIEAPKPRLKELQRRILTGILERIPVHSAAHGFIKGCSIKSFAAPHVGRRVVLRMDLKDFFASIAGPRIQALFRTAGYPESVADLLGGICTNAAPASLWTAGEGIDPATLREARQLYRRPHLPQGAPTSPALANLCAYRIDCRLNGLAESAGAVYTRYADDLAFSGDEEFEKCVERFVAQAAAILLEEGFTVHHRKTRTMRQGVRQYLAGLVINEHINVVRDDFDRLKAILTNCVRHGSESQNREGHAAFRLHLEGRVGFVEMVHPAKGLRLRKILEQIQWK